MTGTGGGGGGEGENSGRKESREGHCVMIRREIASGMCELFGIDSRGEDRGCREKRGTIERSL